MRDDARLEYFLARLPRWMRVSVEFRHPSLHQDAVFKILERHQAAYWVMSGANLPCVLVATAPFVLFRRCWDAGAAPNAQGRSRAMLRSSMVPHASALMGYQNGQGWYTFVGS